MYIHLLTIVFIVLKLTHYIDWSWWWVLAPSWILIIIMVVSMAITLWLANRFASPLYVHD